jgi:hypothetical protein
MTTRLSVLTLATTAALLAGCGEEPRKEPDPSPLPAHNFDKKVMPKVKGENPKIG